jgi:metal-responsive CopG/Arc/MetJ family transcriptional regulator
MEQAITATLPHGELAELDRVCRHQGVSRPDAVYAALRWYIDREGDLPPMDDLCREIEP